MSPKNPGIEEEVSKVDNILNAAQKRFGQYGLCKTTMTEISTDMGLSKAALYYYYPDKESLFEAVIEKEQNEFIEEIKALIKPTSKANSLFVMYQKKRNAYFGKFMNLSKLRYDSLTSTKPLLGKLSENLSRKEREIVRSIIEVGINNKEYRKVNSQDYADFLLLLLQGIRFIALKKQTDLVMSEEEHEKLNENSKRTINLFIKDLSTL
jgi:TetR/AcrR family transcriptional regulator